MRCETSNLEHKRRTNAMKTLQKSFRMLGVGAKYLIGVVALPV